jgi:MFS family permease
MLRKLLHKILAPRHPWRALSFSEISEMYLSHLLRTLALGFSGVFIPIYLLGLGYSFTDVLLFYTLFFGFGMLLDFITAFFIGRFGPKHVMRVGFLFQLMLSVLLIHIEKLPYVIPLLAVVASIGSTFYFLSFNTDFSKVKHARHSGKEVGFMQIMEKTGGILGPIIGGALATYIAPVATFWASSVALLIATIILMLSPEPVQTRQNIDFRGFIKLKDWRNYAGFMFMVSENSITVWLWPVFLSAVVFASNAYLQLGFVSSVAVAISLVIAAPIGKLIDGKKGHALIRYSTIVNSFVHLSRPFVGNLFGSVAVAAANEPVTLFYRLPIIKGYYDSTDDYPGRRIAYICFSEFCGDFLRTVTWLSLLVVSLFFSPFVVCAVGFVLGAIYSQGIRLEKFKAL